MIKCLIYKPGEKKPRVKYHFSKDTWTFDYEGITYAIYSDSIFTVPILFGLTYMKICVFIYSEGRSINFLSLNEVQVLNNSKVY